jgi:acyl-coenzyme A thioesterase PaaI-like protein
MMDERIMEILRERLGDNLEGYLFPPPVFQAMEGKFISLDLDLGTLTTEFPVLERFLNPYQTLQGGILAAAVDNTVGPLSVLVAPPNVTRRLEMTYSLPATRETGRILVNAKFNERDGRRLYFTAEVRDPAGQRLARARAVHYLLEQD